MSFFKHPYVLDSIVEEPESDTIEYKQQFNSSSNCIKSYKKTICAFSNTKGGSLIFGINNSGLVVGMKFKNVHLIDKIVQDLNAICRHMVPSIEGKTEIYEIAKNTYVIVLKVPKSDKDVYAEHILYKRINSSNYEIKEVKILTDEEREDAINRILNTKSTQQKEIRRLKFENSIQRNQIENLKNEIWELILKQKEIEENKIKELRNYSCFSFIFNYFNV